MTINHFGLSGGKDSTALWGWAINESGYPKESIRGSFCDTENEYREVYDQIKALDEYGQKHGVAPVRTLQSEGFLALCIRNKRFPSALARFCTKELKIYPAIDYMEELVAQGHEVVAHSGVRRDESTERSMLEEWGEKQYTKTLKVRVRRPLLNWSIEAVWAAHKRYGLPINPLYFQGRKRVGCKLCCMSSKEDVRLTAIHHPETIDQYRDWEKQINAISNAPGTFFQSRSIPESFRSQQKVMAKDTERLQAGQTVRYATIDDVVAWSMTLRGGKEVGFDFMYEEDDAHLPCQSGYCE